jgi:hypothetical protein
MLLNIYHHSYYNRYEGGRCGESRQACLHKGELGEQGVTPGEELGVRRFSTLRGSSNRNNARSICPMT